MGFAQDAKVPPVESGRSCCTSCSGVIWGRNEQKKLGDHKLLLPGWRRSIAVLAWEEEKQAASSRNANLLLCLRACFKGNGGNHSH
jgi:hypothetical protein